MYYNNSLSKCTEEKSYISCYSECNHNSRCLIVFSCVLGRDSAFPFNIQTLAIKNRPKISLKKQLQHNIEKSQCVSAVLFAPVVSLVYMKWTFIIILNDNDKQTNKCTMIWVCIRLHIRSEWSIMNVYSVISIMIQKDFLWSFIIWSTGFVSPCCVWINEWTLAAPEIAYLMPTVLFWNQIPLIIIVKIKYAYKKAKFIWDHKSLYIKSLVWSILVHSIKLDCYKLF